MRVLISVLLTCFCSTIAFAQLETYAPLPRIWGAEVSPEGRWLATGCSPRGTYEVCIYDLTGQTEPRLIGSPSSGGHINGFEWASEDYLVYWIQRLQSLNTISGMQDVDVSRIASWSVATGQSQVLLGEMRNVTGLDEISSMLVDDSERVAIEMTVNLGEREVSGSRLARGESIQSVAYSVNLDDGSMEAVLHNSRNSAIEYLLDEQGNDLLEVVYDFDTGDFELIDRTEDPHQRLFEGAYQTNRPWVIGRAINDDGILIQFPDRGVQVLDLAEGSFRAFELDGQPVATLAGVWDDYRSRLVAVRDSSRSSRLQWLDETLGARLETLRGLLTEDQISIVSWSDDRSIVIASANDLGQPETYYILDLNQGSLSVLETAYALPQGQLAPARRYYEYTARDGLEIGAWLTIPPGRSLSDGSMPLVVLPHGGPRARDSVDFDWWAAHYASAGYLVMQPNFRGSTGRGQAFIEAGYGGFGTTMIEDIIDGARAAVADGYARDDGYCAIGGSYGGYAAMMLALEDSDTVRCAVSFAGVSDPFALMADRNSRYLTRWWEQYMGSRFNSDAYRDSISPQDRARELTTPLLVLHGDEDTTVPMNQFDGLRRAMRGMENARFVVLEGEDHYLRNSAAREQLLRESGAFLAEHLPVD